MSHPDEDAIARIHRTLLPAAARLCQDGAAVVPRLSASPDLHNRPTVLRLPPDGGMPRPASADLLAPRRPRGASAPLGEARQILRRAPARTRALAALRHAAGVLAQS